MPGLIKVGYSSQTPDVRAKQFNGTHSPEPYEVIYSAYISDKAPQVEKTVHNILSKYRSSSGMPGTGMEWFRCDKEKAVEKIREACSSLRVAILCEEDSDSDFTQGCSNASDASKTKDQNDIEFEKKRY